ncbi:MAG: T9SS type A sorting domain-containing protein, partial [Ignavibacteriales bacterium]|nr:T9SS type A sorting domain-containing protein [Ignavibacteriales bacterium]
VHSYDGKTVIACGSWGAIVRSTNAGRTWENIVSGVTGGLWSVQMLDDTLGWICGVGPALLKTTNAGLSWEQVQTGVNDFSFWSLSFCDKNTGIIGGDYGCLLKTVNGGQTWEYMYVGGGTFLYSVKALDSLYYVVGGPKSSFTGHVLYTTNGGSTFTDVYAGPPINSIGCANDSAWSIVGDDGTAYKTTNRGSYWYAQWGDFGNFCVTFADSVTGFCCGVGVTVAKTTDQGFAWEKSVINEDFYDTYFFKNGKGFALGSSLYKTTDYGDTWKLVRHIFNGRTICFYDSLVGVLSGGYSLANYYTTDGGLSWTRANIYNYSNTQEPMYKFMFLNKNTAYAASMGGILKTTDGGKNWNGILSDAPSLSVFAQDSLEIWAVGAKIYRAFDGGIKWEQHSVAGFTFAYDIFFLDHQNGWIINKDKYLCRTTNGGETWIPVDGPHTLEYMQWYDKTTCLTSGGYPNNSIYLNTDGGWLWHTIPKPDNVKFSKLFMYGKTKMMAVSGQGLIYRYTAGVIENVNGENEPLSFQLQENYPNPFNAETRISFSLPSAGNVSLKIYDVLGRELSILIDEYREAGNHQYNFTASNLSSGVYFYQLQFKGKYLAKSMVLIK